jgi:hypothetical protein
MAAASSAPPPPPPPRVREGTTARPLCTLRQNVRFSWAWSWAIPAEIRRDRSNRPPAEVVRGLDSYSAVEHYSARPRTRDFASAWRTRATRASESERAQEGSGFGTRFRCVPQSVCVSSFTLLGAPLCYACGCGRDQRLSAAASSLSHRRTNSGSSSS